MLHILFFLILALSLWVLKIYFHLKALQISKRKKHLLFNDGLSMNFWEIIRCMPFPFWGGLNKEIHDFNRKGNIILLLFFLAVIVYFVMIYLKMGD